MLVRGYIVQDLVLRAHVVEFRCERWVTSDGTPLTAPLPDGIKGHFGPELRRFILAQYHQGQVTVPRLVEMVQALGVFISKRQVVRLLNEEAQRHIRSRVPGRTDLQLPPQAWRGPRRARCNPGPDCAGTGPSNGGEGQSQS